MTIKGKGFLTGATVTIGAAATEVNVVSDTELTAKTAAGTGSHEVVVTDTNGSSSAGPTYAYIAPPSAPTGVTASAATNQARVSWTAPASDGGSPLTSYTITPYIGTEEQPATTVKGSPPATSATVTGLSNGTSYTFKVAATNEAGTSPPSDASGAVTPRNTIFDFATPQDPPPIADTNSIELGVKFRSEIAGTVTGIRFFKSAANTGTHVGSLWSKEGQLLATATFENETTSGWQQVNFSTPVAINANTTYVAAYLAPNGNYSFTHEAFTTNGVSNPPLSALAAPLSEPPGRNGVYHYSPGQTSVFPDESFADSNYWVDVNFAPNPPAVVTEPASSVTQTYGDAERDGQPRRRERERLPLRIRHHELLRFKRSLLLAAGAREQPGGGLRVGHGPGSEHPLPLQDLGDQPGRDQQGKRPDVHDASGRRDWRHRSDRPDRSHRPDWSHRRDRSDWRDRSHRPERSHRRNRSDRSHRSRRRDRQRRSDRSHRPERSHRSRRQDRGDRSRRRERQRRSHRSYRSNRRNRSHRGRRPGRRDRSRRR